MYPSRGSGGYGHQQQPYSSQSAYSQSLASSYPGSSVGGPEGTSQLSGISRHSTMLGGRPQEGDMSGYRGGHSHSSAGLHYGGQYSLMYGSAAQQIPQMGAKGPMPSALEGRSGFSSSMPDSPKFTSGDYVSSASRGYGHKGDQLYSDRLSDCTPGDRRQYGERHSAYIGRDLPSEPAGRYADSVAFGNKHQSEIYDRMEASLLRQEQMLKTQSLQSTSLDGNPRQADYVAARSSTLCHSNQDQHPAQDPITYGGRIDPDPRSLSMLSGSSYGVQHNPSILGAAPQRNVDEYLYAQGSLNPGYGVSLPPGRDYGTGKGLRGTSLDADYPSTISMRGAHPRIDDRNDDRVAYPREIERREKEHRRDYLHEREKDREKERERQREREREWEREQEREREKARERERMLEQREKDRERERKLEIKIKRERTPARISRERRGPSLTKDGRPLRRESPHREALHRRHSPIKEKRREYVCKVYSSCLVEVERDYLSLDKRYLRLFISPECSKVIVNWPKGNLKLSLYTPVSFEHDFVGDNSAAEQKGSVSEPSDGQVVKSECGNTVWNSKVIFMSGLSQNALEELSSERSYEERVPHFCNMLRFAVLRKNNNLMAIGGPWNATDGGDPSIDDSSLIRTSLRYSKDVAQLDLANCKHWNRFLEVHYDRVGKDGLFSHKEITVLYVPDLSDCLPSFDLWRDRWLAHKRAIAGREYLQNLEKQKLGEKKAGKDKDTEHVKGSKGDHQLEKNKEASSSGQTTDGDKREIDSEKAKGNPVDKDGEKNDKQVENEQENKTGKAANNMVKEDPGDNVLTVDSTKSGKKKIVRRIIKQKVAKKKDGAEETVNKADNLPDEKDVGEKNVDPDVAGKKDRSSGSDSAVKTFKRKKLVRGVSVKTTPKEDASGTPEVKSVNEGDSAENKAKFPIESSSTAGAQDAPVKTTVKKKVVRRVPKRKVTSADTKTSSTDASSKKDDRKDEKLDNTSLQTMRSHNSDHTSNLNVGNLENNIKPKIETASVTPEKQDKLVEKTADQTVLKTVPETGKQKVSRNNDRAKPTGREHLKDEKERNNQDGNDDSKGMSNKELKVKKRSEEAPRHPGLILQTTGSRDSKLQSLSLSLDSLLDYSDKDIEESTFELSLFAESLYEMLQYEMGSRLLAYLQKLHARFVTKRNQRKRQREEDSKKENEESSKKLSKEDQSAGDFKSNKTEIPEKDHQGGVKSTAREEASSLSPVEHVKTHESVEDEDLEEDPEEDPKEDEEMRDIGHQHGLAKEEKGETGKMDADAKVQDDVKNEQQETTGRTPEVKASLIACSDRKAAREEAKKEGAKAVDKDLLQAFRFFDRNRVGYIRVEDMRLIIHNLGKFLSHWEVKELVQSALLESNTGRDDRILYDKLVKMSDI